MAKVIQLYPNGKRIPQPRQRQGNDSRHIAPPDNPREQYLLDEQRARALGRNLRTWMPPQDLLRAKLESFASQYHITNEALDDYISMRANEQPNFPAAQVVPATILQSLRTLEKEGCFDSRGESTIPKRIPESKTRIFYQFMNTLRTLEKPAQEHVDLRFLEGLSVLGYTFHSLQTRIWDPRAIPHYEAQVRELATWIQQYKEANQIINARHPILIPFFCITATNNGYDQADPVEGVVLEQVIGETLLSPDIGPAKTVMQTAYLTLMERVGTGLHQLHEEPPQTGELFAELAPASNPRKEISDLLAQKRALYEGKSPSECRGYDEAR
ncbi:MAG: hypothetical protein H6502_04685 [Candidatus Woesearchaeota archaeon]|nr:MAG: hypothetical protein H6502_04685 [Candidatus Woesearchaeota archaeon]